MTKSTYLRIAVLVAACSLAGVGASLWLGSRSSAVGATTTTAPSTTAPTTTSESPPPPLNTVTVVGGSGESSLGFTYAPPTDENNDLDPKQALASAWSIEGAPGDPTGAEATLAAVTWPEFGVSGDVWVITYSGTCALVFGPPGKSDSSHGDGSCNAEPFATVVDAHTGDYLVSYQAPDDNLP
jgi:hypothetical protein